ncbi:MAG: hypothetical protein HYS26_02280 [Candidatus Kaiserbacteria bacterium]|nr:MAG: hypothetical protein HYS26_02280 [Candidatus Kaiserbacteria bacterium]
MDPSQETLREILRLTQENNRMLHKMRRSAFWGGILKLLLYAALLGIPLWLYITYLGPMMQEVIQTYRDIQGTGANVSAQFTDFQGMLQQFKDNFSQ